MNARSARPQSHRRYRRRILGWGAVGVAGVFAIGGPIFVNRVEDDLERRSTNELEAAGVGGVTSSFSGQDGELRCLDGAVDIPDDVVASIRDLWGVSSLDVTASCTTNGSGTDGSDEDETPSTEPPASTDAGTTTVADTTTTEPDIATLPSVIANDSQFSTLSGLIGDADLTDTLAADGPFTVFAPTNDAFEALGADITGALALDPELLATVLSHHVTDGSIESADLTADDLEMLDSSTVTVELADGVTLVSDASTAVITEADLPASNGVVHAIDHVLIPEGLDLGAATVDAQVGAEFVDGQIVLTGAVQTEAERQELVAAASAQIAPENVIDQLVIDPDSAVDDELVGAFAAITAEMPAQLVGGTVELRGESITVDGVYPDQAALDAFTAITDGVESDGVSIVSELTERAAADADTAAELEADLNALVAAEPILFDPSSATISAASAATLDRVAALAERFGAIDIEIQGHTDSDGLAASNQALSQGRAGSVQDALVERGIDAGTLTTAGFGSTVPILDADGVEDKAASRRVEFVVTATQ